jgi:hypothetical protein
MKSAKFGLGPLLVAVSFVQFLTGCVNFEPTCPWTSHCDGRRKHICTNADEQWQSYNESTVDCGEGKTCKEPLECVVTPLQPCKGSTCTGDLRTVCGKSGYLTGAVEDCTKNGRICRESSSDGACVLAEAPCPGNKSSICSQDQSTRYTGCDKGFGYAVEATPCSKCGDARCTPGVYATSKDRVCRESPTEAGCVIGEARCPEGKSSFCSADRSKVYTGCEEGFGYALANNLCSDSCGAPACVDGDNAGACADSPPTPCGSQEFTCSADRKRALRCKPGQTYYTCFTDCAQLGKMCLPSTGYCNE